MKQWLFIITILLLSACDGEQKEKSIDKNTVANSTADSLCIAGIEDGSINPDSKEEPNENSLRVDSLIKYYIDNTKSEAIRSAVKKDLGIAWMIGDVENRDEMSLIVCQIGRNGEDRFETYQWLYIDTATRTIYEYDVADDALTKWKTN